MGKSRPSGSLSRLLSGGAEGNRTPDFGPAKATVGLAETIAYVPVATAVTTGLSAGEYGLIPGRCPDLGGRGPLGRSAGKWAPTASFPQVLQGRPRTGV